MRPHALCILPKKNSALHVHAAESSKQTATQSQKQSRSPPPLSQWTQPSPNAAAPSTAGKASSHPGLSPCSLGPLRGGSSTPVADPTESRPPSSHPNNLSPVAIHVSYLHPASQLLMSGTWGSSS
ncbi:hypothetical protein XPA_007373 [Xanthoria parietina]